MKYCSIILFLLLPILLFGQNDSIELAFEKVEIDTTSVDPFKGSFEASFKLDYYNSTGYSFRDRYWYEVIILDSLVILNFKSPDNDDWDYVSYQKRFVLGPDEQKEIEDLVIECGIKQKIKGRPLPPASGYGAEKLFIETPELKVAGGLVYVAIGDGSEQDDIRMQKERQLSSTIEGDYDRFFKALETLFKDLNYLIESKDKEF
ncbi:MAG: hypothetical protein CL840_21760 [Crocinitomicaceae bacterium]|nr:hypothetical protein [Crocinitomicaceae bacterium]|tara:strand:+ start:12839 stop:13450 length:612 start_codon:yes stop_codon:yes gene_type:complete